MVSRSLVCEQTPPRSLRQSLHLRGGTFSDDSTASLICESWVSNSEEDSNEGCSLLKLDTRDPQKYFRVAHHVVHILPMFRTNHLLVYWTLVELSILAEACDPSITFELDMLVLSGIELGPPLTRCSETLTATHEQLQALVLTVLLVGNATTWTQRLRAPVQSPTMLL